MQFSDLKTALSERGFDDFSDTKLGRLINEGRRELDRMDLWPWLEASATGTAPMTITDLGEIEAVINTSRDDELLLPHEYQRLLAAYGDLSTTGVPVYYYRSRPSGDPVVATYPTSSDTIGVQYWKVTTDLSGASDEPAAPDELHPLILDISTRRAWREKNQHDEARAIQEEVALQIADLRLRYTPGVRDLGAVQTEAGGSPHGWVF
jgi:hypothetical protein